MEWIIGIIIVLIVLAVLFGGRKEEPKKEVRKADSGASSARRSREYATIYEKGKHRAVTSDEVVEMFANIRERLKAHRAAAKAMEKLADKFLATGKLDEAAYDALSHAETEVAQTMADAEALYDKLYFNTQSASERYWKLVDDLSELILTLRRRARRSSVSNRISRMASSFRKSE